MLLLLVSNDLLASTKSFHFCSQSQTNTKSSIIQSPTTSWLLQKSFYIAAGDPPVHRGWLLAEPRLAYFSALVSTCDARPKRAQHIYLVFHHILACTLLSICTPPNAACCITIPSLCPPAPSLAPPPQTQSNLHMRVPRRCSTPWRRSALPPTSSLACALYWPHCLCHTLNVSNAYPLPAPSSHWGFHVADAARRGVTMCSALPPPTSSLPSTFVSHFIILLPAPSTSTQSTLPQPRPPALNIHMGVPRSHALCLPHTLQYL